MSQSPPTHAQRLAELRRELGTRQRVYPDWVRNGRLTQRTADYREQILLDILAALESLYQAAPQPVQASLFAADHLPTPKPGRGLYSEH